MRVMIYCLHDDVERSKLGSKTMNENFESYSMGILGQIA